MSWMNTPVYHTNLCFFPFQCLVSRAHPPHVTMTLSVQISVWRCSLTCILYRPLPRRLLSNITPPALWIWQKGCFIPLEDVNGFIQWGHTKSKTCICTPELAKKSWLQMSFISNSIRSSPSQLILSSPPSHLTTLIHVATDYWTWNRHAGKLIIHFKNRLVPW